MPCKLGFEGIISKPKDSPSCPPKLSAVQSSWTLSTPASRPLTGCMALRSMTYRLDVRVGALTWPRARFTMNRPTRLRCALNARSAIVTPHARLTPISKLREAMARQGARAIEA